MRLLTSHGGETFQHAPDWVLVKDIIQFVALEDEMLMIDMNNAVIENFIYRLCTFQMSILFRAKDKNYRLF